MERAVRASRLVSNRLTVLVGKDVTDTGDSLTLLLVKNVLEVDLFGCWTQTPIPTSGSFGQLLQRADFVTSEYGMVLDCLLPGGQFEHLQVVDG